MFIVNCEITMTIIEQNLITSITPRNNIIKTTAAQTCHTLVNKLDYLDVMKLLFQKTIAV